MGDGSGGWGALLARPEILVRGSRTADDVQLHYPLQAVASFKGQTQPNTAHSRSKKPRHTMGLFICALL